MTNFVQDGETNEWAASILWMPPMLIVRNPVEIARRTSVAENSASLVYRFEDSTPPITARVPVVDVLHGHTIEDPYRWLEDQNSPATRLWIRHQQRYKESMLEAFPYRRDIRSRVLEHIDPETPELPVAVRGRCFFTKRAPGTNQAALYMRIAATNEEILLVDPAKRDSRGTTSITLGPTSVDGERLAYLVRRGGEDEGAIEIFDVKTMSILVDSVARGRHQGFCPFPLFDAYLYTSSRGDGYVVRLHRTGTDAESDDEVLRSNDPSILPGAVCAGALGHIVLSIYHYGRRPVTDYFLTHRDWLGQRFVLFERFAHQLEIHIFNDRLYALTDWGAPNRRVITTSLMSNCRSLVWSDLVPETALAIHGMSLIGGHLFLKYLCDLRPEIRVYDLGGKLINILRHESHGTATLPRGSVEQGPAFYRFSSFNFTPTVFEYDLKTHRSSSWSSRHAPTDPAEIRVRLDSFRSFDGTMVPLFLAHHRDTVLSPTTPLMLTAYGGFGLCQTPRYSARAALWMRFGGVYASAAIRGGSELGESWHHAATGTRRQNAFDDFIAAAEFVIAQCYTSSERLAIVGGSNGGLLVAATLTQRPELFRAAVCFGPFLDMLRYHLSPFARPFLREFGSAEDPSEFRALLQYSPYHAVSTGRKYPAVLFVSGDCDTRCDPMHVRKMVARLQAANGRSQPILLDYDIDRGHAGQLPLARRVDALTDQFCFLMAALRLSFDSSSLRFLAAVPEFAR